MTTVPDVERYPLIAFYSAVASGRVELLRRMVCVENGGGHARYFATQDHGAGPPLLFAAAYGQLRMARALLGGDVGAEFKFGRAAINQRVGGAWGGLSALHVAAHLAYRCAHAEASTAVQARREAATAAATAAAVATTAAAVAAAEAAVAAVAAAAAAAAAAAEEEQGGEGEEGEPVATAAAAGERRKLSKRERRLERKEAKRARGAAHSSAAAAKRRALAAEPAALSGALPCSCRHALRVCEALLEAGADPRPPAVRRDGVFHELHIADMVGDVLVHLWPHPSPAGHSDAACADAEAAEMAAAQQEAAARVRGELLALEVSYAAVPKPPPPPACEGQWQWLAARAAGAPLAEGGDAAPPASPAANAPVTAATADDDAASGAGCAPLFGDIVCGGSGRAPAGQPVRCEPLHGVAGGFVLRGVVAEAEVQALRAAVEARVEGAEGVAGAAPGDGSARAHAAAAAPAEAPCGGSVARRQCRSVQLRSIAPPTPAPATAADADANVATSRALLREATLARLCDPLLLVSASDGVDGVHCEPVEPAKWNVGQAQMAGLCERVRRFLPPTPFCEAGDGAERDPIALAPAGHELASCLRCYRYRAGEGSLPHFDAAFREHEAPPADGGGRHRGRMRAFSAFSFLIYLSDAGGERGGATTFFRPIERAAGTAEEAGDAAAPAPEEAAAAAAAAGGAVPATARGVSGEQVSRRGLTWAAGGGRTALYEVAARVWAQAGDCLVFPHGNGDGVPVRRGGGSFYPNPLHEGSIVRASGSSCAASKYLIRTDVMFKIAPAGRAGRAKADD